MANEARSWAALVACALTASSCAPALIKLPAGQGSPLPASEAAAALASATSACRGVTTMTADVAVSGSASGQRLRARLLVGVESPASARVEATAPFGAPYFIFVATGGDATLLLPRDARVLQHGTPHEVLDAVAGIPLTAADLDETLTGCVAPRQVVDAASFGESWRRLVLDGGRTVFLRRSSTADGWVLSVVSTADWRVDYPDRAGSGVPAVLRLASVRGSSSDGDRFNLQLALSQVETNAALDAAAFRVDIPRNAVPITLDELRHARPGVREN